MGTRLYDKIDELDLEELGFVARLVLSRIYTKLRKDNDFDYNMYCIVPSIGSDAHDVDIVIIDGDCVYGGVGCSHAWRV